MLFTALASERSMLLPKPSQRSVQVLRREVGRQRVKEEDIGIHRLHRYESAQAPASTPTHDEIQARDFGRSQYAGLQSIKVPLPAIVHKQIDPHAVALPGSKCCQLHGKLLGRFVANYQQCGTASRNFNREGNTGSSKLIGLGTWPPRIVLSESVNRYLFDAKRLARLEQRQARWNPAGIPLLLGKAMLNSPAPVAVRNEAYMPGQV